MRLSDMFKLLALAASTLSLAAGTLASTPPTKAQNQAHSTAVHRRPLKRTWTTGPATMPPDTEVLPPRPSAAPPALRAVSLSVQGERSAARPAEGTHAANSRLAGKSSSPLAPAAAPPTRTNSGESDRVTRVKNQLNCLRDNLDARQAYYNELLRTVEQIRAGVNIAAESTPAPCTQ